MKKTRILALMLSVLLIASFAFAETGEDPVVIKIGETLIPLSEAQTFFNEQYGLYKDEYDAYGQSLTAEDIKIILNESIELLAFYTVMDMKVEEFELGNITEEDKAKLHEQSAAEFEENVAAFAAYFGITIEEAENAVDEYGITADTLYEAALADLPYRRLYDKATEGTAVTDEEIFAKYDSYVAIDKSMLENNASTYEYMSVGYISQYDQYTGYDGPDRTEPFYIPEGFRMVKHILLEYPEETTAAFNKLETDMSALDDDLYLLSEEMYALENVQENPETEPRKSEEIQADIDAKQAELDELEKEYEALREEAIPALQPIIDEITAKLKDGETFDALIEAYGNDPGMTQNKDGYMVHKDSILWDTTFRDAATALEKVGDVSDPVPTGFGVHIIQYANDAPSGTVPITEEMTQALRETLLSSAKDQAFSKKLDEWLKEYNVEKHPELIVMPESEVKETEAPAEDSETAPEETEADTPEDTEAEADQPSA